MPEVIVLIEGYLSNESNGRTCPTISLVKDGDINIIVDPGTARKPELIIDALAKNGLKVEDIDIVFLTHSHYDHFRNLGLFPAAQVRDFWSLWNNDIFNDPDVALTQNTRVVNTPGHSYDGLTLLVKTARGITAICGDVWFKENKPAHDSYAEDQQELNKSRQKIKELADFIIPGHGKMFKK